jgi:predicted Zn-dependent peptidase
MSLRALLLFLALSSTAIAQARPAAPAASSGWTVPTAMKTLPNGLRVVVSEDHSAPTFGLCIAYHIGFRLEPQGRTGFAHLFEHMMFEGTPKAPKGTFDRVIEGGGGSNNGDTRWDFTEYIESAPVSALDPVLWLEADRMKDLDFSTENLDNQRKVVEEEVRVNVLNQPYGGFEWLDLPQKAFDKYPNSHNFYGDFKDLDAANIADVKTFFERYYVPNNAVLAIVGDVTPDDVFARVEKFFGSLQSRPAAPPPDFSEAPQTAERRATEKDPLARVPAVAIGYRMPPHNSHDAVVAAVVAALLHNGDASRLYQSLVKQKKVAVSVDGGSNWPLGNAFEYEGPTLMTSYIMFPNNVTTAVLVTNYDLVIRDLAAQGPAPAELTRVVTKLRSDWYADLEVPISRASTLAHAVLFDGNTDRVNRVPDELARVTAAEVKAFCAKYLVPANRTILDRVPAAPAKEGN